MASASSGNISLNPGFQCSELLALDGRTLFLTEHTGDCEPGGSAYIVVDDVDALYERIRTRVRVHEPPEKAPWGAREMLVIDPDGNRLRFANQIVESSATEKHDL